MKTNVLIVDDSASIREIIKHYLQEIPNLNFMMAGDGLEAEKILQESLLVENLVDIMFLDWMMPNQTGFDLLRRMRETEGFAHRPKVIMLTAETYPAQIEACIKFKVSAYVTKPFTQDDLIQAFHKAIGDRSEHDAA
ncbi:response regulator [Bdellovibrionota bacterium FG-1]